MGVKVSVTWYYELLYVPEGTHVFVIGEEGISKLKFNLVVVGKRLWFEHELSLTQIIRTTCVIL